MANQDLIPLQPSIGVSRNNNGLSHTVVGFKPGTGTTNTFGSTNYNGYMVGTKVSTSTDPSGNNSVGSHVKLQIEDQICIRENPMGNVGAPVIETSSSAEPGSGSNRKHIHHKQQRRKSSTTSSQHYVWHEFDKTKRLVEKYIVILSAVVISSVLILLAVVYAQDSLSNSNNDKSNICLSPECVKTASYLLSGMDRSVDPCSDFFTFACGMWNKRHVIPEDKSSISMFEVLADQLQVILKGVLEEPINSKDSSATQKAKIFYKSCMNVTQIRRIGDGPVKKLMESYGGWPVTTPNWTPPPFSVESLFGRLKAEFNEGVLVEQWVGPDDKNSSVNILQVRPSSHGVEQESTTSKAPHERSRFVEERMGTDRNAGKSASPPLVLC